MNSFDKELESIFNYERNVCKLNICEVHKGECVYDLYFNINDVLCYKDYSDFLNKLTKYFKNIGIDICVHIEYNKQEVSNDILGEYTKQVLKDLSKFNSFFRGFDDLKRDVSNNEVKFHIESDCVGFEERCLEIKDCFSGYGLDVNVEVLRNESKLEDFKIQKEKKLEDQAIKQREQNIHNANMQRELKVNNKNIARGRQRVSINKIPLDEQRLEEYKNTIGMPLFILEGYIFRLESRQLKNTTLVQMDFCDDTDSILVKKFVRDDKDLNILESFTSEDIVEIYGDAQYDTYSKKVVVMAKEINFIRKKPTRVYADDAVVKRVELHCHTKMSNLDGITSAADYLKNASAMGHTAIAITDHDGLYAVPEVVHTIENGKMDIKPIFGSELTLIDDSRDYDIAFPNKDSELRGSSFVVFDLETTGFSQTNDRIIEIAAVKIENGYEGEIFETFVDPEMLISEKITDLTSITDDMVKGSPNIETILPEFMKFCEGSILVAHNARFDVGFIDANLERLNMPNPNLQVIDTLNAMRAMYSEDIKRYNLKAMSNFFKIKQEHHHRAIDDTRVTALCFLRILQEMYKRGVSKYSEINNLIDPNIMFKQIIPKHAMFIAKNQTGFRNLYHVLSDSLTVHFKGQARVLKSYFDKYREGILLGSSCVNGVIFETALNGSKSKLASEMAYFDYIEVQPPTAYAHLFSTATGGKEAVLSAIKLIVETAKSIGKIVVATGDCHYFDKDKKQYRDILINSMQVGGGRHNLARYDESPDMHFRTTNEMIADFDFLDKDTAYEIVVTNTNKIADMVEKFQVFSDETFAPRDDQFKDSLHIPSIKVEMQRIIDEKIKFLYGDNPHPIVTARAKFELDTILSHGYASIYYVSHLLVVKSLNEGYLVGSRGSVGSSFAATMMDITEINPLPPHYRCPKCHWHTFQNTGDGSELHTLRDDELPFKDALNATTTGFDLPDAVCPICGEPLKKDGQTIPFETFLGIGGKKQPDIDLNFSGEYQSVAHEYIRSVFGNDYAFRAGTVATVADKNAYGYVKAYMEKKHLTLRDAHIGRIAQEIVGVKRSTGQHPGGIIVVPNYSNIFDVTPIQFPANNTNNAWRTTHYDYHSFEKNLLKFDILGHDDPTLIKYLMDYVHEHQEDFAFSDPMEIPVDDPKVYSLFSSPKILGVTSEQISSVTGAYAIPEFGTRFVRNMLIETKPKSFNELVIISGLSHGTDVWANNAQELIAGNTKFGVIPFNEVIGCRDDIMVYLQANGLKMQDAFNIMEFVRKGKIHKNPEKWPPLKEIMLKHNIPEWYIWSCEQIKYMFPKAHAAAYVLMALRIAWFKVNSPSIFYSAYLSKRAKAHDVEAYLGGPDRIRQEIDIRSSKKGATSKDQDLITVLQVALEMTCRGINFLPVDVFKSDAVNFVLEGNDLRIPFNAVDGLGEAAAYDIVAKREEKPFTSIEDVIKRTKLNKSLKEEFKRMGSFGNLDDEDEQEKIGIFALLG